MVYKSWSTGTGRKVSLMDYPLECPECHNQTIPTHHSTGFSNDGKKLYAFLSCPNPRCDKYYVGEYVGDNYTFWFIKVIKGQPKMEIFGQEVTELSPAFIKIYNESFTAEQLDLLEICGVGFRKALEFLIKDYLIRLLPEKAEQIRNMFLGKCITDLVEDTRIKETAKRAVWLGNDHTHYIKKWEDKDLSDLKKLIRLTVNWVESEILTADLNNSMPE